MTARSTHESTLGCRSDGVQLGSPSADDTADRACKLSGFGYAEVGKSPRPSLLNETRTAERMQRPNPRPPVPSPAAGRFATRYVQFLSERSIVDRLFGNVRVGRAYPFRDKVDVLEHDALGMFFYNQRALFFGAAGLFLVTLFVWSFTATRDRVLRQGAIVLFSAWFVGIVVTLALHGRFKQQLDEWAAAHRPLALPPIYDRYFLIDCVILGAALFVGRQLSLPFNGLAFLLCANIIVYSAYTFIGHASRLTRGGLIVLFIFSVVLILPIWETPAPGPFATAMTAATITVMLLVTLFSVTMMSALATLEHHVTRQQLSLLGEYQQILLSTQEAPPTEASDLPYSERLFRKTLRHVIRDLCTRHPDFWYRGIAAWFVTEHDKRGKLFWPGPYEKVPEVNAFRDGVPVASGFLITDEVVLLHSLKAQVAGHENLWKLRLDLDAPAAIVPLRRDGDQVGALLLFGDEHSPPVPREDEQFLQSLASIMVTSWDQWRSRFSAAAHKELDSLFACETLDDLFPAAVKVLRKYLFAAGCMIVFRPNPDANDMRVAAVAGFSSKIKNAPYVVGLGQTGKCAQTGATIRFDDVPAHREAFDDKLFRRLEAAHGEPIQSWMAIPIGRPPHNFGVVKIVNRTDGPSWFTADDEALGEDLAIRLQVTIEKFMHLADTDAAKNEAQLSAAQARQAQVIAESAAKQRLQDLMTITHQMQAPLVGVVGALTGVSAGDLAPGAADLVGHATALVEDAITVSYGTFTTFALEAGRDTAFFDNDIDAVAELEKLATRIQRTNPRPEIRFIYRHEPGFPRLRLDGRVFTTVLYSLIHNASKYADDHTDVALECSFERAVIEPAVKVKSYGARIFPDERDAIFERFVRGRSVGKGQIYAGVGLGLWVARQLMRAIGGDLTVELSHDRPRLSVFVVHVPVDSVVGVDDV